MKFLRFFLFLAISTALILTFEIPLISLVVYGAVYKPHYFAMAFNLVASLVSWIFGMAFSAVVVTIQSPLVLFAYLEHLDYESRLKKINSSKAQQAVSVQNDSYAKAN